MTIDEIHEIWMAYCEKREAWEIAASEYLQGVEQEGIMADNLKFSIYPVG